MLTKKVRLAWNLIHILNDEYEKIFSLALRLNTMYAMNTTDYELKNVVHVLAKAKLIETRQGSGVRRAYRKSIKMEEVLEALGITFNIETQSPAGRLQFRLKEVLRQAEFDNSKILHKIK